MIHIKHRYATAKSRYNIDRNILTLRQLKPGEVARILDIQRDIGRSGQVVLSILHKLLVLSVVPGGILKTEFTFPAIVFKVENTRIAVDYEVADRIQVSRLTHF